MRILWMIPTFNSISRKYRNQTLHTIHTIHTGLGSFIKVKIHAVKSIPRLNPIIGSQFAPPCYQWNGIIAKFQSFFIESQTHSKFSQSVAATFLLPFISFGCRWWFEYFPRCANDNDSDDDGTVKIVRFEPKLWTCWLTCCLICWVIFITHGVRCCWWLSHK